MGAATAFFTSAQYQNWAAGNGFVSDAAFAGAALKPTQISEGNLQELVDRFYANNKSGGQPPQIPAPLMLLATGVSALDGPLPVADAIAWALVAAATVDMAKRIQFPRPLYGAPGPHTGAPLRPGEFRPGPPNFGPLMKWTAGALAAERFIEQTLRHWRDQATERSYDQ